jgi:hypothetical protein
MSWDSASLMNVSVASLRVVFEVEDEIKFVKLVILKLVVLKLVAMLFLVV